MKYLILSLALATALIHSPAQADGAALYLGLQYAETESDDGFTELDLDASLIRLGITHPDTNWAGEVRTGVGSSTDTVSGVRWELERISGLYGLYHIRMNDRVSFYGVLGFSTLDYKAAVAGASDLVDDSGLSYGVGFEAYGFNVEWMQYLDTADIDATAIGAGYNYHF